MSADGIAISKRTNRLRPREPEFARAFDGVSEAGRREVLKAMGASLAMASLAGCTAAPHPDALPYVTQPDDDVLGSPKAYATAVTFGGYAQPVMGVTYEGRPIKLEGLPEHPASRGATDAITQAALLGLYDPDRSKAPRFMGRPADWSGFDTAMVENAGRLDARGGEGFRLLTGPSSSPTFARQIAELMTRWPKARWHAFDPVSQDLRLEAARLAFGRPLEAQPRLEACRVIVSFDDDVLGSGPRQTRNARAWSSARSAFQRGEGEARLLVAEPAPSLTGAMAGDRLIASADQIGVLLQGLAGRLGVGSAPQVQFTARQAQWLDAAARALDRNRGAGLVLVGGHCEPAVQALALHLNARLDAIGRTLGVCEPILLSPPDGASSLEALTQDLRAGRVDTLAILDANPVYAAPADLEFAAAMQAARLRVHAGLGFDETAAECHWHAPLEHELETWADARAVDGRPSLIQPLVRPFDAVRARPVVLETIQGRPGGEARAILLQTWSDKLGGQDDPRWRQALARGFLDTPAAEVTPSLSDAIPAPAAMARSGGLTALIRPDPTIWDGAFANNPWLQELPKPFNKLTWDNAVLVAPALASRLRLGNGDVVCLAAAGHRSVEGPVWITPGLERATVVVQLGYGRRLPGQLADGRGYDAYPLRTTGSPWRAGGVTLTKTGARVTLASTQLDTDLQGFDFVRTAPRSAVAPGPPHSPPPSFYPPKLSGSPQWGMAIDTDTCIGCSACVTACDAENNVPMTGKDQVANGREMHWMRIDHYYDGASDDPAFFNQPVPCMHCEQAPCEMGCPVGASVHTHDGLNMQVYNRCVGTRTCSSFCPYKVRHFNWFDYTLHDPPELRAARNPEVTVRSRGIMEKCNYCVQRIEKARIQAKVENRPIREGEVVTACQQVCPTEAIVFGDVSDPDSAVSRLKAQQRNYALLEEVNTRPRTTYLSRLQDGAKRG
ncbi:4Fe-4S dicluster domain-containing protein [Phenylobacterium sp.]|uniref:4Fe-4S dicluster domain-containing protein n=1 Tax=Phenylobacterium sp. TaxID=1871053 RepID=UPI002F3EB9DF